MSAGSGASNLGYGNLFPFSNVNPSNANLFNMHDPANFTSRVIPGTPPGPLPGLAGTKDNVAAARGEWPGPNIFKGGAKNLRRKIKNITRKYKNMKGGSRKRKSLRNKLKRSFHRKITASNKRKSMRRRGQRGGYSQYQNNLPMTPSYQVAGVTLPANQSALANPPPITKLSNCVNCVDNYNHYTGKGFPSKGH
jgi:hypothetical protein